jgi:hypothetical protein
MEAAVMIVEVVRFAESVVFCWLLSQNAGLNDEVQFNALWGNFWESWCFASNSPP